MVVLALREWQPATALRVGTCLFLRLSFPDSLRSGEEGRGRVAGVALGQQTGVAGLGMEPAVSCPEGMAFLWGEDDEARKWISFLIGFIHI